jgi:hypothetical protein
MSPPRRDYNSDMSETHKKPAVALWSTVVVIALLVMYPLSWGPAWWLIWNVRLPDWTVATILAFEKPAAIALSSTKPTTRFAAWYWGLGIDQNKEIANPKFRP